MRNLPAKLLGMHVTHMGSLSTKVKPLHKGDDQKRYRTLTCPPSPSKGQQAPTCHLQLRHSILPPIYPPWLLEDDFYPMQLLTPGQLLRQTWYLAPLNLSCHCLMVSLTESPHWRKKLADHCLPHPQGLRWKGTRLQLKPALQHSSG